MIPLPFNLGTAKLLAEFSRRAYSTTPTADKLPGSPWSVLRIAAGTETTVLIEDIGSAIVLAFRGTRNLRDWLTDVEIRKAPCGAATDPARIHRGFLAAADSILPAIIEVLLPPGADKAKTKPIILTGHSLGGAIAPICAYFLQREGFAIECVYTLASPRSGNAAWRDEYNSLLGFKTFRLACAGDLVPLIPGIFTPLSDGFRHVGREILLDGPRLLMEPNHYTELALDGWRAWWAIKRGDIDFILDFHSIEDDYLASLNSLKSIA